MTKKLLYIFLSIRPTEGIKNLIIYFVLFFNGKLFDPRLFWLTTLTFIIFRIASGASYIYNDLIDVPFDQKHPTKKFRPIASKKLKPGDAIYAVLFLSFLAIFLSLLLDINLTLLLIVFLLIQISYSIYFKKIIVLDILVITMLLMIRLIAGQLVTGYQIPIWLSLAVFFFALYIISVKRHSELINYGVKARLVLKNYSSQFISFFLIAFAILTTLSYSIFCLHYVSINWLSNSFDKLVNIIVFKTGTTKWMFFSIPLVILIMIRYAQIYYQKREKNDQERKVVNDGILVSLITFWFILMSAILYLK